MARETDFTFIKGSQKGKGLPYAIVTHEELMSSNELFTPTVRDFHVIFWFKKGSGTYYIDFEKYHFTPNSIVLLSKDHLQYFESFDDECELQSIVFHPDFLYRSDNDLKHLFHFNSGTHENGIHQINLSEDAVIYLEAISNLMKNNFSKQIGDVFYHLLCAFLIKCESLQLDQTANTSNLDEKSKIAFAFHDLLERNFKTETNVAFYTDSIGIAPKTLTRILKEKYQKTSKNLIDERRMLEIKRQLKGTTKSIKEIAYFMGFEEPTNLVKFFKKHLSQTPSEFRA